MEQNHAWRFNCLSGSGTSAAGAPLGVNLTRRMKHARQRLQANYMRHLFALALFAGTPFSHASGLASCIATKVSFNGIVPLDYATVSGQSGEHVYLHHEYPTQCPAGSASACRGPAYLLPGQAVTIGKECGAWAYVQYLGGKKITKGWIGSSNVVPIRRPPKSTARIEHVGKLTVVTHPHRYRFNVIRGAGVPVCEAYLQRLNQTPFYAPPYCGRPESVVVPGFSWLSRVPLNSAQTAALYPRLVSFKLVRRSGIPHPLDRIESALAASGGSGPSIIAWRYKSGVDISNDGAPRNVVVWGGQPFTSFYAGCGYQELLAGEPVTVRWEQIAFIANADTTRVEDAATLQIFGNPTNGLPVPNRQHRTPVIDFVPIGDSIGIFNYGGLTYYDTFYAGGGWPDFYGQRADVPSLDKHLAVFLRRDGVTKQVCEYTYKDRDFKPNVSFGDRDEQ